MIFTIYGKPQGKGRPRFTRQGHAYTPDKTRDYEELVKVAYIAAGGHMIPAGVPVRVEITAVYPIPKSTKSAMRGKMASGAILPTVKPDWDNVGKIVCDALNGIAWHDDAQVTQATVYKVYGETPVVTIDIREV